MTNKEIKSYLKRKAEEIEVKDYSNNVINNVNHQPKQVEFARPKRKWFVPVVAFALAICLTIAIIPRFLTKQPEEIQITSTETVLADEIVTAGSLLTETVTPTALNIGELPSFDKSETAFDIKHFLSLGNSFTNKENIKSQLYKNTDKDYSKYEYKLIVTDTSTNASYTVYYNTTNDEEIKGVILVGSKTYNFEAEIEKEEDESEVELTLFTGTNSYLEVSNSLEDDGDEYELEYSYKIVNNGKVLTEVEMEFSRENGKKESSISILHNTYIGELHLTSQSAYSFAYSPESVSCTITIQGFELTISIPVINGAFEFDESLLG